MKGGRRAGAGRKQGSTAPQTAVVSSRVGEWALSTLEEHAKLNQLSLSAYSAQILEKVARKKGAEAPKGYKPSRHKGKPIHRPYKIPRECAPDAPCSYSIDGSRCTIETNVIVPARGGSIGIEKIPARYCLIEAEQLRTSHNPLGGFGPTRGYPADAQERDYLLQAEQGKVLKIAQNYEPSLILNSAPGALDGLPVATEDRYVLGGNGRAMATMLVYAGLGGVPASTPRNYLLQNARQFGLAKKDVLRFKHPLIVRTIRTADSSPRTLAEWSRRLNAQLSQQLDPVQLAVSRAKFVSPSLLVYLGSIGENETLNEWLSSERSLDFVKALQTSGVIDSRSASLYVDKRGLLNADGRQVVIDLLVARILPNAREIHAIGPQAIETIARSAYYLIATEGLGEYSLLPSLRAAISDRLTMRAQDNSSLSNYLRQTSMFSSRRPLDNLMLQVFFQLEDSPVKFMRVTRRYLQLARGPGSGQAGLFGSQTPENALREAAEAEKIKFL